MPLFARKVRVTVKGLEFEMSLSLKNRAKKHLWLYFLRLAVLLIRLLSNPRSKACQSASASQVAGLQAQVQPHEVLTD